MLDENAHFGGQSAAGRPYGKDWHCSLKGGQKTDDGTFSELRGEKPRWRLGDPQMLKNTHPHLFDIAGSKDAGRDNTFDVLSGAEAPRLHRTAFGEDDSSMIAEIFRRLWGAVACEVLRSGDENDHGLRESSRNQSGVWEIP